MAKKATELTAEELAAKRSASAKKAAATRAANKAKKLAEAAALETPVAEAKPKAKAKAKTKAEAKPKAKAKKAKKKELVLADDDAPLMIDHAAFTADEEDDYDEPLPFEADPNAPTEDDLDEEAMSLVNGAVGKTPKAKKEKKAKKERAPKKENKKAKKRAEEAFDFEDTSHLEAVSEDTAEEEEDAKESNEGRPTFKELGLIEPLQRAVADMGFEYPTVIQAQAIPVLLESDTDLVGLAQTGTG